MSKPATPTDSREARQDRFMYWHGVKHPGRGNQMAFAMVDAAIEQQRVGYLGTWQYAVACSIIKRVWAMQ